MQRDWIDYASSAGSIATALTLIYLVIKEWRTRKHVTDLTIIAEELRRQQANLEEQNLLQKTALKANARPNVSVLSIDINDQAINIDLVNRGKVAYPIHIVHSGKVVFTIPYLPHSLDNEQVWRIEGVIPKENSDHFCILLYYKDMFGNYYYSVINGFGRKIIQLEIVDIPKEQLDYLKPMWDEENPFKSMLLPT